VIKLITYETKQLINPSTLMFSLWGSVKSAEFSWLLHNGNRVKAK